MRFVVRSFIIFFYAQTILRVTSVWVQRCYHTQHSQYTNQLLLLSEAHALFRHIAPWFHKPSSQCQNLNVRHRLINGTFNIDAYIVPICNIIAQYTMRIQMAITALQILNVSRYKAFCWHALQGIFMEKNAKWQKKCLLTQLTLKKCELPLLTVRN